MLSHLLTMYHDDIIVLTFDWLDPISFLPFYSFIKEDFVWIQFLLSLWKFSFQKLWSDSHLLKLCIQCIMSSNLQMDFPRNTKNDVYLYFFTVESTVSYCLNPLTQSSQSFSSELIFEIPKLWLFNIILHTSSYRINSLECVNLTQSIQTLKVGVILIYNWSSQTIGTFHTNLTFHFRAI